MGKREEGRGDAQFDEHFAQAWLGHVQVDDFGRDAAGLVIDGGLEGRGEGVGGGHGGGLGWLWRYVGAESRK